MDDKIQLNSRADKNSEENSEARLLKKSPINWLFVVLF